jgi:multimeric flavodoxin WrbA
MAKVLVLYYSSYGHIERMAHAEAEGARMAGAVVDVNFTATASQHGGQEATLLSFHIVLFHLGFIVIGLPYSFRGQLGIKEMHGISPYGATTIVGADGARMPSPLEIEAAQYQGRHVAAVADGCHRARQPGAGMHLATGIAAAATMTQAGR